MSSNPTKQNPTPTADASIAAASTSTPAGADKKDEVPKLGALEEDDEFEEFAEQDWSASETSLAHLASSKSGAAASDTAPTTTSHLWEDNWDDDDVEEDFSKQLRAELEKKNGATAMST